MSEVLYKFYDMETMTQEKLNGLALARNIFAKENERLKNELEVSRNNEETYRLEMLDITKRLGLDEETLFDDVKDKVERLNKELAFERQIKKEVREYIEKASYLQGNKVLEEKDLLEILDKVDKENI